MDKLWKSAERHIARVLGGKRLGCTGAATADVVSDWLTVEVKTRKALPKWLVGALDQAVAATDTSHLPIVILHEAGRPYDQAIVMIRLGDFMDWFGDGR